MEAPTLGRLTIAPSFELARKTLHNTKSLFYFSRYGTVSGPTQVRLETPIENIVFRFNSDQFDFSEPVIFTTRDFTINFRYAKFTRLCYLKDALKQECICCPRMRTSLCAQIKAGKADARAKPKRGDEHLGKYTKQEVLEFDPRQLCCQSYVPIEPNHQILIPTTGKNFCETF